VGLQFRGKQTALGFYPKKERELSTQKLTFFFRNRLIGENLHSIVRVRERLLQPRWHG
jgi:hypothetical protein